MDIETQVELIEKNTTRPRSARLLEIADNLEFYQAYARRKMVGEPDDYRQYTKPYLNLMDDKLDEIKSWIKTYHYGSELLDSSIIEKHIWDLLQELIIFAKAMQVAVVG